MVTREAWPRESCICSREARPKCASLANVLLKSSVESQHTPDCRTSGFMIEALLRIHAHRARGEREVRRDQMGHSSIQVTFDTYGHLFPNSRATAAKKLQQAMFTGRKNGFGSSLVAKPGKRGKKKPYGENEG